MTWEWFMAINQHDQRNRESGDRTCDSDIEQRAAGTDGRAYPNYRAQRANQSGRGDEEGKRGVHAVVAAIEVVSHLVRQKNQQQRGGEGNSQQQAGRLMQRPAHRKQRQGFIAMNKRRHVVQEIKFHLRAHHQRGEDGRHKQQNVQPVPGIGRPHHVHFRGQILGLWSGE